MIRIPMNEQHILVISRYFSINVIIQQKLEIGPSHIHPHKVVGIRDFIPTLEQFICTIYQHKSWI